MPLNHTPFPPGPVRSKKILSLGFYRTGSQSLKEALTILGYQDVFHSSVLGEDLDKFKALEAVADANIACLPSYNGRAFSREDWDEYFGPCEALTDVTPFSHALLRAYPEAKVILVRRDFDAWADSFVNTLVKSSSEGVMAWLSATLFQPILGIKLTQSVWKMYMGLIGVSQVRKLSDRAVLWAAYDRHHDAIRRMVPEERLLEINLKDLDWEPLCKFLGKSVPKEAFPRLNESSVLQGAFKRLHRSTVVSGIAVLLSSSLAGGLVLGAGMYAAGWKIPIAGHM
jgi:hypothetical protein